MRGHVGVVCIVALLSSVPVCAAAENGETAAAHPQVPPDRSLPPEPNAVFTCFVTEIKAANWDKALEFCSAKVRAKAAEYDSADSFFNAVLPLTQLTALQGFRVGSTSSRNNKPIGYDCEIQLKEPDYRYPVRWHLSLVREDLTWAMDFPTKPLDIWMKHAVLLSKRCNGELEVDHERNCAGLEVHLVPSSEEFIIGRPMLFRLELKNVSTETLFYENTAYMINDPLIIKDASGATVPFVGGDCQTALCEECIEPNETVTLVEQYDVRSQYHLTKAGAYSFQFKNWSTPLSNVVEIDVKPGPLSPLEECVEALRIILPKGWALTRRVVPAGECIEQQPGDVILVYLVGRQAPKTSTTETSIGVSMAVFLEPPFNANTFSDCASKYNCWGNSPLGTIFVRSISAEDLWPDYKEQLIKALQIEIQSVQKEPAEINKTTD